MYQNSIILIISLILLTEAGLPTKAKKAQSTTPITNVQSNVFAGAPPTVSGLSPDLKLRWDSEAEATIQDLDQGKSNNEPESQSISPIYEARKQVALVNVQDYSMTSEILGIPYTKQPAKRVEPSQPSQSKNKPANLPKKRVQKIKEKEQMKQQSTKQQSSSPQRQSVTTAAPNNKFFASQINQDTLQFFPDIEQYDITSEILNKHTNRFERKVSPPKPSQQKIEPTQVPIQDGESGVFAGAPPTTILPPQETQPKLDDSAKSSIPNLQQDKQKQQLPQQKKSPANLPRKRKNDGTNNPSSQRQPAASPLPTNGFHATQIQQDILQFFPDVEQYDVTSEILNKHTNRFQKQQTPQIKQTKPIEHKQLTPQNKRATNKQPTQTIATKNKEVHVQLPTSEHKEKLTPKLVPTVRPPKYQPKQEPKTPQQVGSGGNPDQQFQNEKNMVLTVCSVIIVLIGVLKCLQWSSKNKGYISRQQNERPQIMMHEQETQLELQSEEREDND